MLAWPGRTVMVYGELKWSCQGKAPGNCKSQTEERKSATLKGPGEKKRERTNVGPQD